MPTDTQSRENTYQQLPELGADPSYKESIAKSIEIRKVALRNRFDHGRIIQLDRANGNSELEKSLARIEQGMAQCGDSFIIGICENGDDMDRHTYAKAILCNRDQCPTCGTRNSDAHLRRFARILPKVQQLSRVGYFTIQFLQKDRQNFRSKEALQKAGKIVRKILKAWGFDRGLRRWDWFGEPKCPVCWRPMTWQPNQEDTDWHCRRHGNFSVDDVNPHTMSYHPHLNVLVEGRYVEADVLVQIQKALSEALIGTWDVDLDAKGRLQKVRAGIIMHYEYAEDHEDRRKHEKFVRQSLHWARYIEKPTFLGLSWDPEEAAKLYGFRNGSWWGHWQDSPAWDLETQEDSEDLGDLLSLQAGECPICGSHIKWDGKVMSGSKLRNMILDQSGEMLPEGGGYHLILL